MSWKAKVEPYATAWSRILASADRGLIHGMEADAILHDVLAMHGSPADTAMFLRDMVEAGALRPVAKDLAGAGHSVRAFRGLQYKKESDPCQYPNVEQWLNGIPSEAADAHVWTFEKVRT